MSSDNLPENGAPQGDWNRRRVSYLRMGRSFIDGQACSGRPPFEAED